MYTQSARSTLVFEEEIRIKPTYAYKTLVCEENVRVTPTAPSQLS